MSERNDSNVNANAGDARRLFLLAGAAFIVVLGAVVAVAVARGEFSYAVDDAYIHLAVARNLAFHGTWGIVPGVFESASSSPGWTVILAAGLRAWPFPDEWLPLVLNVAAALWLLRSVTRLVVGACGTRLRRRWTAVVYAPVIAGLVPLVLTGMEHTLHAAIVMQLIVLLDGALTPTWSRAKRIGWYVLLAAGVVVRVETVMFGVAACIAAVTLGRATNQRRQFGLGWTLAAMVTPLVAIGVFDLVGGAYLLPNSITAKSALTNGNLFDPGRVLENMGSDPGFAFVGLLCLTMAWHAYRRGHAALALCPLTVGLTVFGMELTGSIGVFGRYEGFAYLAAVAVVGAYLLRGGFEWMSENTRRVAVCFVVLAFVPLLALLVSAPRAMSNINSQQAQMGRFLAEYYDGRGVAVNDIGQVAFRHRGDLVDFEGLGSLDVLTQRRNGKFDRATVARDLAEHDVDVVAVFERFYRDILPTSLVPVGRWCLTEPVLVNSDRCVTWFATTPEGATELRANLEAFDAKLPSTAELELL